MRILRSSWFPILLGFIILVVIINEVLPGNTPAIPDPPKNTTAENVWLAPVIDTVPDEGYGSLIRYGHDLIVNTSRYLGPKGTVARISNGMNCQNCHIDAGLRSFGNSFAAVASTYPKYRDRSGKIETVAFRINECMERSMNGEKLDSASREMQSMIAYLEWVGKDVPKGSRPEGAGIIEIPILNRAASVSNGKMIYLKKCQSCHMADGQGMANLDSNGYLYPPLWGPSSYNVSAGLYRISRFAAYVRHTMPFGSTHDNPQLTDEEAWDVAAFVNSQPRPKKFFKYDWPDLTKKPVDYPFGPYTDGFSELQHKYGPFQPIREKKEMVKK